MRPLPLSLVILLLAGCGTPQRNAQVGPDERARADAAKSRYWQIQHAQRTPTKSPNPDQP